MRTRSTHTHKHKYPPRRRASERKPPRSGARLPPTPSPTRAHPESHRHLQESPLTSRTVKDKAQHAVVLDKEKNDRLQKDVQSYRLITVATLVDRLKINGSLARKALNDLEANGQIKKVVGHSKLNIYST
jgi:small subunit ribosomal protein S25e